MRIKSILGALVAITFAVPMQGQQDELPRPGNLQDVLACAGSNEVFWVGAMKVNPRNPLAHEAKRKAGWYSAVALWIFRVDTSRVVDAVATAERQPETKVLALAKQCRSAPDNWRE
jgi:hypothetical protein